MLYNSVIKWYLLASTVSKTDELLEQCANYPIFRRKLFNHILLPLHSNLRTLRILHSMRNKLIAKEFIHLL